MGGDINLIIEYGIVLLLQFDYLAIPGTYPVFHSQDTLSMALIISFVVYKSIILYIFDYKLHFLIYPNKYLMVFS